MLYDLRLVLEILDKLFPLNDLQRLEDKWRHDGKISSLLCSAQEELHIVNSNRLENNDEIRFATKKDIENLEDEQNRLRESNDEDDMKLLKVENSEQALFLEQQIEKYLGIKNLRVRGEIGR